MVLFSSDGEGLSNVIIEHCVSGLLVDNCRKYEIVDAVNRLLGNEDESGRMGCLGKK